jgi:hypothetical protein
VIRPIPAALAFRTRTAERPSSIRFEIRKHSFRSGLSRNNHMRMSGPYVDGMNVPSTISTHEQQSFKRYQPGLRIERPASFLQTPTPKCLEPLIGSRSRTAVSSSSRIHPAFLRTRQMNSIRRERQKIRKRSHKNEWPATLRPLTPPDTSTRSRKRQRPKR